MDTDHTETLMVLAEFLAHGEGCRQCNLRGIHGCADELKRKLCWIKKAQQVARNRKVRRQQ